MWHSSGESTSKSRCSEAGLNQIPGSEQSTGSRLRSSWKSFHVSVVVGMALQHSGVVGRPLTATKTTTQLDEKIPYGTGSSQTEIYPVQKLESGNAIGAFLQTPGRSTG